jgi:protein-tyrosine-phosphatase
VLAVAFANKALQADNLEDLVIASAGTDPDQEVSSAVAAYLKIRGLEQSIQRPRKVSQEDLSNAYKIVSLGCDLDQLVEYQKKIIDWGDVPPTDEDLDLSAEIISMKVNHLMSSLE